MKHFESECLNHHLQVFVAEAGATVNHICKSFELSECRRGMHMMSHRLPTEIIYDMQLS